MSRRNRVITLGVCAFGLTALSYFGVRDPDRGGTPLKYEFSTPSGARLTSVFDGSGVKKFTAVEVKAYFGGGRKAPCCESTASGLLSELKAWLDPPSVMACSPDYCSGHYMKLDGADCGGCWIGNCVSGTQYGRGCQGHDYGCCCGMTTCPNS